MQVRGLGAFVIATTPENTRRGPGAAQERPKRRQEQPKRTPRAPQEGPGGEAQERSWSAKRGPVETQERLRRELVPLVSLGGCSSCASGSY
jgi:hypothetical protein